MKILFIGGFFPKNLTDKIRENSKGPIANANNTLQWAYIEGLYSHLKLDKIEFLQLISLPQIGAYPFRYKHLFFRVRDKEFYAESRFNGICCSFINLVGFKHISRYYSIRKALFEVLCNKDLRNNVLIIVYDLQVPIIKAIVKLKKQIPTLRICLITPDLQGFTGENNDLLHRCFEYLEKKILNSTYKSVDFFVLLSKYMIEKLPIINKPHIVIEGIYNPKDPIIRTKSNSKLTKNIFYSGALDKRNGVHYLLQAFKEINNPSFRLILCGDGCLKSEIENAAKQDLRIEYKGQLSRAETLALQQEATLLVNPRQSSGEFTRYSFPSKTIEYFASSIPVLMYHLDGIPDEYYNYCFTPKDNTIRELKNSIIDICNKDQQILYILGNKAREFVEQQKNSLIQTEKLLKMAQKLFE